MFWQNGRSATSQMLCYIKPDIFQSKGTITHVLGTHALSKPTNIKKPTKRCFVKKFKFSILQHQTRPPQAQGHENPAAEAGSWKDCKQRRRFFRRQQVCYKQPSFPIKSWCSSGKVDSCYNFFSKFPRPGEVFISYQASQVQVSYNFCLAPFVSLSNWYILWLGEFTD